MQHGKNQVKGGHEGLHDLHLEFWDPLHSSGAVHDINFIFGTKMDHEGFLQKKITSWPAIAAKPCSCISFGKNVSANSVHLMSIQRR